MKLSHDPETDAFYIRLFEAAIHDSEEIEEGIILDYDVQGRTIGVEILDFMRRLKEEAEPLPPALLVTQTAEGTTVQELVNACS